MSSHQIDTQPSALSFTDLPPLISRNAWFAVAALTLAAQAQSDDSRLLTSLSAEVSRDGVVLSWTIDESRAHLISGFSCAYRSPAHLRLGVSGIVPCEPNISSSHTRTLVVTGLPEYGEYLFEVVAQTAPGTSISWPIRALHYRVVVSDDLAGPAGSGSTVSGAGPLVESCGPDDDASARRWRLSEIVSAEHLSHPPGRGWVAGGDSMTEPDWPEPLPFTQLLSEAGIADATSIGEATTLATGAVFARADRTKALLRQRRSGDWELKLHSSYPFGGTYEYEPKHLVSGWGDSSHPVLWSKLWLRTSCPPPDTPHATHDVTLALSDEAGEDQHLANSSYGWWTVAPVGISPERMVAAKAGLFFGSHRSTPPSESARWRGRLSGHLFRNQRRWALTGNVELDFKVTDESSKLFGRVEDIVVLPLHAKNVESIDGEWARLLDIELSSSKASSHGWSGDVGFIGSKADSTLIELPLPEVVQGDWQAAVFGQDASEVAGRLRLWTPLPEGTDNTNQWPTQLVLVAGFGTSQVIEESP